MVRKNKIDRPLSNTTPNQNRPRSNGNEEYFTRPRALKLEPHHQMQFNVIFMTSPFGGGVIIPQWMQSASSKPCQHGSTEGKRSYSSPKIYICFCCIATTMTNYTNTFACEIITTLKTSDTVLRKIYLSLYLKGLCVRGSWRPNRTATYWPPTLIALSVSFPFSWAAQPGAWEPSLSGCWFSLPHLITNWSGLQNSIGGLEGPFCWVLAFSTTSLLQNSLNFLCTELYNSSTPTQYLPITGHRNMHFRCLWNGMFNRHRAEITVMQFTDHSLLVHQFATVPWDFNPFPYCQPSSPTPMEYALPPSLEWHVWPGWRSTYNTSLGI